MRAAGVDTPRLDERRLDPSLAAAWVAAGALAAAAAGALALAPQLLVVLLALGLVSAVVVAAFAEPRTVAVLQVAFVVGYVPNVLAARFGLPVSAQTVTLLLLVAVFARRALDTERLALPREARWVALLFAALVVSLALAADRGRAATRLLELAEIAALVVLLVALLDDARWLRRAVWAFAGTGGALAALGVVQQLVGPPEGEAFLGFAQIVEGDRSLLRTSGPTDPNFFAQFVLAAGVLCVYLGLGARARLERAAAWSLAAACLGAIFFTYSRGALLALGVAVAVAAVLRRLRPWALLGGLATIALAGALILPADAKERLVEIVRPGDSGLAHASDASLANRFAENAAAVAMFTDYPITGVGPANYSARYHEYAAAIGLDTRAEERPGVEQAAHNLYLETLAETGVLGGAALFGLIALAVRGASRLRRAGGSAGLLGEGLVVAFAGYFAAAMFLHSAFPQYLWMVLALGLAAGRVARRTGAAA